MTVGIPDGPTGSRYRFYREVWPEPGETDFGPAGAQSNRLTFGDVIDIGVEMVGDGLKLLRKKGRELVVRLYERRTDLDGKA